MAKVTGEEFCVLVGITYNNLATYFGRKKFVYEPDGYIDTCNLQNAAWIKKRQEAMAKKTGVAPPEVEEVVKAGAAPLRKARERIIETPAAVPKKVDKNADSAEYFFIDTQTKKKKLEKLALETDIAKIKHQKLSGEVIPVEPLGIIFFQYKQMILVGMKTMCEALLNEFAAKYSLESTDIAEYRKYYVKGLNTTLKNGNDNFESEFNTILNDFISKKGIGERE
jgi:hypothetical protein